MATMKELTGIIRGRKIMGGRARGEAVVSSAALCFRTEFNPLTGKVTDPTHPLYNRLITNKVLVIPCVKGSSGNPMWIRIASLENNAPLAFVNVEIDSLEALACVVNRIPTVLVSEKDFGRIQDRAWLDVDADNEVIKIYERK